MIISYAELSDVNYGSKIIFKGRVRCYSIIASDTDSSDGFSVSAFAQIPQNTLAFSLQTLFRMLVVFFFFPDEWSS